jgi:hypothetical protein
MPPPVPMINMRWGALCPAQIASSFSNRRRRACRSPLSFTMNPAPPRISAHRPRSRKTGCAQQRPPSWTLEVLIRTPRRHCAQILRPRRKQGAPSNRATTKTWSWRLLRLIRVERAPTASKRSSIDASRADPDSPTVRRGGERSGQRDLSEDRRARCDRPSTAPNSTASASRTVPTQIVVHAFVA